MGLIDDIAPDAPIIYSVTGDNVISESERLAGVVVSGTAEAQSHLHITWGSSAHDVVVGNNGLWSAAFTTNEIPTTNASITAFATDNAGNVGASSSYAITSFSPTSIFSDIIVLNSVSDGSPLNYVRTTGLFGGGFAEIYNQESSIINFKIFDNQNNIVKDSTRLLNGTSIFNSIETLSDSRFLTITRSYDQNFILELNVINNNGTILSTQNINDVAGTTYKSDIIGDKSVIVGHHSNGTGYMQLIDNQGNQLGNPTTIPAIGNSTYIQAIRKINNTDFAILYSGFNGNTQNYVQVFSIENNGIIQKTNSLATFTNSLIDSDGGGKSTLGNLIILNDSEFLIIDGYQNINNQNKIKIQKINYNNQTGVLGDGNKSIEFGNFNFSDNQWGHSAYTISSQKLSDGSFVVMWTGNDDNLANGAGVFGQRFDQNLNKIEIGRAHV